MLRKHGGSHRLSTRTLKKPTEIFKIVVAKMKKDAKGLNLLAM